MANCVDLVAQAFPELDRAELEILAKEIERVEKDPNISLQRKKERLEKLRAEGKYAQATKLKTAIDTMQKYIKGVDRASNKRFRGNSTEALLSLLEGKEGNMMGVESLSSSYSNEMTSLFSEALRDAGLDEAAASGKYDVDVYDTMMRGKEFVFKGKDEDIVNGLADIYRKMNDRERHMLNGVGANVAYNDRYVHKVIHSGEAISQTSFKVWAEDFMRAFDLEESFGLVKLPDGKFAKEDITKVVNSLQELYTNIGKNWSYVEDFDLSEALDGVHTRNGIVDRMNRRKTFTPRDGASFQDYNMKYGTRKSLRNTLMSSYHRNGQTAGVIAVLGNDPQKTFDAIVQQVLSKDTTMSDGQKKMASAKLKTAFDNVTDRGMYGHDSKMAKTNQAIRNSVAMAKLGKATLSAIADIVPTIMHSASVTGDSVFGTAARTLGDFMASVPPSNRKAMAKEILINAEAFQREMLVKMFGDQHEMGRSASMVDTFFKYTLLESVTEISKSANARLALQDIDIVLDRAMKGKLNHQNKNFLNRFGFEQSDLVAMQRLRKNGIELTPRRIREAPNELFEGTTKESVLRKVHVAIDTRTKQGVPTPDARTRRVLGLYTPADTVKGQAIRYFSQFKSTITKQSLDLEFIARANSRDGNLKNYDTAKAMSKYFVLATGVGTMIYALKQYVTKGSEAFEDYDSLPDFFSRDNIANGIAQGGAFGIFGDMISPFIAGRSDRTSKAVLFGQAAGPAVNIGTSVLSHLSEGDTDKLTQDAMGMIPYQNAWFASYFFEKLKEDLVE